MNITNKADRVPLRSTLAAQEQLWKGWHRQSKRHRWIQLAQDADYGVALNALLDAVANVPGHHELLVARTDPNCDATAQRPRRMY